jgi:3-methyladenine DNA glycosylase AlkC
MFKISLYLLQPTDALVYDGVYLIANSLDKVYRENSAIIKNLEAECYQENPKRDWVLGVQMRKMFTTVLDS